MSKCSRRFKVAPNSLVAEDEPVLPPVDVPELLPPVGPELGPVPELEGPLPPLEVAAAEVAAAPVVDGATFAAVVVAAPKEGECRASPSTISRQQLLKLLRGHIATPDTNATRRRSPESRK
jgi:hypothetical protein